MFYSVFDIPAVYSVQQRTLDDGDCFMVWLENKILDVYSTKQEAEQCARQHYAKELANEN